FLRDGHYLRHIRRMKRLYIQRRDALLALMSTSVSENNIIAGLSLLLTLDDDADDVAIAEAAKAFNLAPAPLSPWYATQTKARKGLLLGVTNLSSPALEEGYQQLAELVARHRS
ncbi:MAG: hypothetical protein ACTH5D_16860, partial [Halomonas sp.]